MSYVVLDTDVVSLASKRRDLGAPIVEAILHSTGGALAAYAEERGRPRPQNDMWVAACCLYYDLPLATRNVKDFADFAEYEGLTIITD